MDNKEVDSLQIEGYYYLINKDDWTTTAFGTKMTEEEAYRRNDKLPENRKWMNQEETSKHFNPENKPCSGVNHHLYTVCMNCGLIG